MTAARDKEGLPARPSELKQWVAHVKKKPYSPRRKRPSWGASVTDPRTWGWHDQAEAAAAAWADGIGFVLTAEDDFAGIDLDHCRDPETGVVEPWARELVEEFDSYTEISQSGTGLHILARGEWPGPGFKRDLSADGLGKIEVYDRARYLVMTGDVFEQRRPIAERQERLDRLHERVGASRAAAAAPVQPAQELALNPEAKVPERVWQLIDTHRKLRDAWNFANKSFDGDVSAFDMSLTGQLVRYGCADQEITDTLIHFRRRHNLQPEKALRDDYIARTIAKARRSALAKLPFTLVERVQYGHEEASYDLVLADGKRIHIRDTRTMRSPTLAGDRLAEASFELSADAVRDWSQILKEMVPLTRVEEVASDDEIWTQYLWDYLLSQQLARDEPGAAEGDLVLAGVPHYTEAGEVFISARSLKDYLLHRHLERVSEKIITTHLKRLGWSMVRRNRGNLWQAPPEFARELIDERLDQGAEPSSDLLLPSGTVAAVEGKLS